MNLYFASSPSRIHIGVLKDNGAKNLLFSYAFIKNPEKLIELIGGSWPERVILDSGAFSMWSNGKTVNLEEYAQFCKVFKELLPKNIELNVVNLDVLPGTWGHVPSKEDIATSAEEGWQNMLYLESLGLKVIHVFHQHEDFAILEKLKAHSDYIGISPANDVSMNEKLDWLNKVFLNLKDKTKTHGFAVTSHKQLLGYPFYSVDSSSWVTPARFGRVAVFTDRYEIKTFPYKSKDDIEKFWPYISYMGIQKIAHVRWEDRVGIAIKAYKRLGEVATEVWAKRGVTWT
jgi:hypothetical protein